LANKMWVVYNLSNGELLTPEPTSLENAKEEKKSQIKKCFHHNMVICSEGSLKAIINQMKLQQNPANKLTGQRGSAQSDG